jgi:NTE family protein
VLGGGGVLGEAWMMGVLAGIEDGAGLDLRECETFIGTSAGSIVAAHLAAGNGPRRPPAFGTEIEIGNGTAGPGRGLAVAALGAARFGARTAISTGALFASPALAAAAPGGAALRSVLLRALPRPSERLPALAAQIEHLRIAFDGRLRITAVDRGSGRRVVFGSPGAPEATVTDAVLASCAVPWLFAPVRIGGREYVDGGVWSPTNLDVAPAGRDTHVLCLNPTAGLATRHPVGAAVRNLARSAVAAESLALRARGARVRTVAPNGECAAAMGSDFMDREPRARVLAAGYRQGLQVATQQE